MTSVSKLVFVCLMALILRLVLSVTIYSGDVNNHIQWGKSMLQSGYRGAYEREYPGVLKPTYPPLALYSFVTSYGMYQATYWSADWLNNTVKWFPSHLIWLLQDQDVMPAFHKIFSIFSDLGIGILIYAFARRIIRASPGASLAASAVYLFNPAVFYNSALWGQMESPPLFFTLLAFYFLLDKKTLPGHLFFVFALLTKQSTIIFLPAFLLYSLYRSGFIKTFFGILFQFSVFYLFYLPFFHLQPSTLNFPLGVYIDRLNTGSGSDFISDHAFNLWALWTKLAKIPDYTIVAFGKTAAQLGQLVFVVVSGLFLLPLVFRRRTSLIIQSLGLITFSAFMLLTRMHERYLGPTIPIIAITATGAPQLWPLYGLISLAHLINLYHNWWFPPFPPLELLISNWYLIVGTIVTLLICWIAWSAHYWYEVKKN